MVATKKLEDKDVYVYEGQIYIPNSYTAGAVGTKVLENLREKDRAGEYGLTRDLLMKAIETGTEEIIVSPDDRKAIGRSFINSLNADLIKAGKKGEITLSDETRNIRGGFILKRGRAETNSSFDTLLTMLRDDVETRVAGILFGETGAGGAGEGKAGAKA